MYLKIRASRSLDGLFPRGDFEGDFEGDLEGDLEGVKHEYQH